MFERFTERARQVVVLAQDEARLLRHNYIGTEHILLGLLRKEDGLAARILESWGVSVEDVRAQVERIVGKGDEVTTGQIPFTPRAKKVLELALREARWFGHSHIDTEHVLLGLVRENDGVAARILFDFEADADKVRGEIFRTLSEHGGPRAEAGDAPASYSHSEVASSPSPPSRLGRPRSMPRRVAAYDAPHLWLLPLVTGWALFGLALVVGVLLGWMIWG